jgi:hypothetical protein
MLKKITGLIHPAGLPIIMPMVTESYRERGVYPISPIITYRFRENLYGLSRFLFLKEASEPLFWGMYRCEDSR